MAINEAAALVEDQRDRHDANAIGGRDLAADVAQQVDFQNRYPITQLLLEPVHDGLGQQAGRSEGRVELDDCGPALDEELLKLGQ